MAEDPLSVFAERLQELCLRLGLTVATAESCTGGLVASAITDVGGSSGYFRGGLVVYSNDAKIALLGVAQEMLQTHGAVSAQVAIALPRALAIEATARLEASREGERLRSALIDSLQSGSRAPAPKLSDPARLIREDRRR